jgi:hypothetical protein
LLGRKRGYILSRGSTRSRGCLWQDLESKTRRLFSTQ